MINRIKQLISEGRLHGQALIQALGLEANAVSTLQSAQAAEAQKAAAKAAAEKAKLQAQIQNSIDPLKLEVQLSKDQADNAKRGKIISDLKALREAARDALASGDLSLQQEQIDAWNQITQDNQQIAAALKAKKQKSDAAAKSLYHEINLSKETAGLGLTPAQRKALEARLSQLGPGNTARSGDWRVRAKSSAATDGRSMSIRRSTLTARRWRRTRRSISSAVAAGTRLRCAARTPAATAASACPQEEC